MSHPYDIHGITANGEALAEAWTDAILADGETGFSQAAIGYADRSWGDGPALASGLLAVGCLVYSLNRQLGDGSPAHVKPILERILVAAGSLLSMYSMVLKNTDLRLGNAMAQTVAAIIGSGSGPAYPILIDQSKVPNR